MGIRGQVTPVVRRAGLVDVPAMTRLIVSQSSATKHMSPEQTAAAGSVLRLLLAHHALEAGDVWLAGGAPGDVLAIVGWKPPESTQEPDLVRIDQLLAREVGARGDLRSTMRRDAEVFTRLS